MLNKVYHLIASVVCFGIPLALSIHGTWQDLTLGGILNAIYLLASHYLNPTTSA